MGNTTEKGAGAASRGSRHRKRRREVTDEDEASSSPNHGRRHRRRRRHSRSRTPSPSPSLGRKNNTHEEEEEEGEEGRKEEEEGEKAASSDNLPASLDRHACLRCVKFLASEPDFECVFPARSIRCTRCTSLNSKCEVIPPCADAEARLLLNLQAEYENTFPCEPKTLRQTIVDAAEDVAALARMAVNRRPKTPMQAMLAVLRNQEASLRNQERTFKLLSSIDARLAAQGQEEKRKEMGKKRG